MCENRRSVSLGSFQSVRKNVQSLLKNLFSTPFPRLEKVEVFSRRFLIAHNFLSAHVFPILVKDRIETIPKVYFRTFGCNHTTYTKRSWMKSCHQVPAEYPSAKGGP